MKQSLARLYSCRSKDFGRILEKIFTWKKEKKYIILSMKETENYIEKKCKLFSLKSTFEMSIGFIFSANIFMAKCLLPFNFLSGSVAARVRVDLCLVLLKAYIVHTIF